MNIRQRSFCLIVLAIMFSGCNPVIDMPAATMTKRSVTQAITPTVTLKASASPRPKPSATPTKTPRPTPAYFDRDLDLVPISGQPPFAIENSIAFYTNAGKLIISDFSDPLQPKELWRSAVLGTYARGLSATNNKVYVAAPNKLYIWDVSESSKPIQLGVVPHVGEEIVVSPQENLLYSLNVIKGEYTGVSKIDISTPAAPREILISTLSLTATYFALIDQDRLFYSYVDRTDIFDLSHGGEARLVGSMPTSGIYTRIIDRYAYINSLLGIQVFDVSDPSNPRQIYYNFEYNLVRELMNIHKGRGYFTTTTCDTACGSTVEVFDFSEPTQAYYLGYARIHPATHQEQIISTEILGEYLFAYTKEGWYILRLDQLEPAP